MVSGPVSFHSEMNEDDLWWMIDLSRTPDPGVGLVIARPPMYGEIFAHEIRDFSFHREENAYPTAQYTVLVEISRGPALPIGCVVSLLNHDGSLERKIGSVMSHEVDLSYTYGPAMVKVEIMGMHYEN